MASNNSLFASLEDSEIRIFQKHSVSPARGLRLLKKSSFTEQNGTEFARTVKLMIKAAQSSNTLAPKSQMELFGQKLYNSFATKRIHFKVAPDLLMLQQHISDFLPLHVEPPPSPLPPLKDYSSDDDSDTETSPPMSAFDVALEEGSKPKASSVRSTSPAPSPRTRSVSPAPRSARPRDLPAPRSASPAPRSASPGPAPRTRSPSPVPRASCSRDRTRSRSPLQTEERSRPSNTPKDTNRGEKSKKSKRNRSVSSSVGERDEEKRSHSSERSSKKRCVWNDMTFSLAKKIKGKYFNTSKKFSFNFILVYIP